MNVAIREREKLLREKLNDRPNNVDEDIEKRLEELEQEITINEEYNDSIRTEALKLDDIEMEIRALSNDIEEEDRTQLSSSLRQLLRKLDNFGNEADLFPPIQPVKEKRSCVEKCLPYSGLLLFILFALDFCFSIFLG